MHYTKLYSAVFAQKDNLVYIHNQSFYVLLGIILLIIIGILITFILYLHFFQKHVHSDWISYIKNKNLNLENNNNKKKNYIKYNIYIVILTLLSLTIFIILATISFDLFYSLFI
ncbi:hypothetical protein VBM87_00850 [Mycoplasma sp. 744]|uniref:hypothetical protein n=1 Tax=Mycoplasma sp. 744 TaxID=3108531 RepID=UPI002B1E2F6B|nr:hypothetical protein [Mycoplasma sp. 744]MEA4115333.1 hypothetical protein [Mycoplasma sp. 744]